MKSNRRELSYMGAIVPVMDAELPKIDLLKLDLRTSQRFIHAAPTATSRSTKVSISVKYGMHGCRRSLSKRANMTEAQRSG